MSYTPSEQYNVNDQGTDNNDSKGWGCLDFFIGVICYLAALPLFLLLSKILPDPDWFINIDRILLFIGTCVIVYFITSIFKILTILVLAFGVGFLTVGSIASGDHYGWRNAFFDYASLIRSLKNDDSQGVFVINFLQGENEKKIKEACDYSNPDVRNCALKIIDNNKFFMDKADYYYQYRTFIQSCAICKYVNEKWYYVSDPSGEEYFAKASESIRSFKGDCDDHAIVLSSLIKAIGGETRIVLADGHAYPEIKIDKREWNDINYLIKGVLFVNAKNKQLHYHYNDNDIWLNMDYTESYPGARFLDGTEKILSIVYP